VGTDLPNPGGMCQALFMSILTYMKTKDIATPGKKEVGMGKAKIAITLDAEFIGALDRLMEVIGK
jgi:hypothetical protein